MWFGFPIEHSHSYKEYEPISFCYSIYGHKYGCTDMDACNYNPNAKKDDGSCHYGIVKCWDGSSECNKADCPDEP